MALKTSINIQALYIAYEGYMKYIYLQRQTFSPLKSSKQLKAVFFLLEVLFLHFKLILQNKIYYIKLTAVHRVLNIKLQNWLKYKIGEKKMLKLSITLGLTLTACWTTILVRNDHQSLMSKMCSHSSSQNIQTLQEIKVCHKALLFA